MSNVEVESFFDTRIMLLNIKNNLAFRLNQIIKRIFDIVCTVCGGILISPLLLAVFVWVKLDSLDRRSLNIVGWARMERNSTATNSVPW